MADVKWIKLRVGMFDGMSFKKIKKEKLRDKLTAVWFELMDFAGRCNHDGAFIMPREEIPFYELSDIATMIDRDESDLAVCMDFFIKEGMVSVIDDVYMLSNWSDYQNTDGLERIKKQNRARQAKYRENQRRIASNVTFTNSNAAEEDIDTEEEKEEENKPKRENSRTLFIRLLPDYNLSDKVVEKMSEWITYKMERRGSYKEQGMKTLLRRIENSYLDYGEDAVCDVIDSSMASGYVGILFDKLKQNNYTSIQDAVKNRVSAVDGW